MTKNLTRLFDPDPPSLESDLRELFCNREAELDWAVESLRAMRSDRVYAIHGTRRSGKSHFARRLLLALADEGVPYRHVVVNAHNRGSARGVLREVYFQFEKLLQGFQPANAHQRGVQETFVGLHRLVNDDRVEWTAEGSRRASAGVEQSLTTTLGVPNAAALAHGLKGTTQVEDGQRLSEKVVGLSDRDVVRQLGLAADLLHGDGTGRCVLLLLDDLDLVDRDGVEGSEASNELLDLLRPLAEQPGIVIVATVRNAYTDGRKNVFHNLTELGPMRPETLLDVYKRRLKAFNDDKPAFDDDARKVLIDSAEGMVGIFLRNCHEVVRRAGLKAKQPLTQKAIDSYARWKLDIWRSEPEHVEAVVATEEAARAEAVDLVLPENMIRSALHLALIRPVTGRKGVWAINPLYANVLRGSTRGA